MEREFRFSGEELARFIPKSGFDLVAFDVARAKGDQLTLIDHYETLADAEAAMLVVDLPCLISFALPPRPKQLDLFADLFADPTSVNRAFHGSRGRGR